MHPMYVSAMDDPSYQQTLVSLQKAAYQCSQPMTLINSLTLLIEAY